MFEVDQRNPRDGKFIVKKTDDFETIGQYTFYVKFWLAEHQSMTVTGDPFVVDIMNPCTPARLELYGRWPLLCPKPEPAKI